MLNITLPDGVTTIQLKEWRRGMLAYLWVETGDGDLLRVTGLRPDWWVVTGYCSWCSCPGDTLYLCPTQEHVAALETALRARLATKRAEWYSKAAG